MMEESLSTVPTQVAQPKKSVPKSPNYIHIYVYMLGSLVVWALQNLEKAKQIMVFYELGPGIWELGARFWELGAESSTQPISLLISFSTLNKK